MPFPAVPQSLGRIDHRQSMPGHVFSLYLPFWNQDWEKAGDNAKRIALQRVTEATPDDKETLEQALLRRQKALAQKAGAENIEAISLSPFVTGMGEEHAVENGFAFLNPYGLPYLAGSGVKGVIRRAAEELAEMGEGGWTFARVAWLFGYEDNAFIEKLDEERQADNKEAKKLFELLKSDEATSFEDLRKADKHLAGTLSFWDVIIDGALGIDILTPHYGKYYEGNEPPHDAGQPQPNPFLVVAPGAHFTFHVTCNERPSLLDSIKAEWRALVRAAFDHAFEWGGFGAKTAVGYGILATDDMLRKMKEQAAANKVPEVGDKVEIISHEKEQFIGRKGEIIKILDNPVIGEKVAQLRPIDDGGKLKGLFPLSGLKCITEE